MRVEGGSPAAAARWWWERVRDIGTIGRKKIYIYIYIYVYLYMYICRESEMSLGLWEILRNGNS